MKRKIMTAGVLLLLLFLFLHPKAALCASRDGMKLWLDTLLPTLLPFLILTGILVHTGCIEALLSPLAPLLKKILGLSSWGTYVFLLGMLCGYPMGAKLASDLYSYGKISKREAHYLLTFCCNASPAFLTTYLYQNCLDGRTNLRCILLLLLLSDVLCMLFFRFLIYKNNTATSNLPAGTKKETPTATSPGAIIDVSIMNGFETITRLGGYILIFSILAACISYYWPFLPILKYVLLGMAEVTTGLNALRTSGLPYSVRFSSSMLMTAFGGLCVLFQTKSVMKTDLSILPYFASKILNTAVTGFLLLVLSEVI